ncbi:MAG: transcription-repair coupling factor [Saprospiraceae bacterium]|nr:transcription-repair coupling factor [Saprospiraceae bacterium]
MENLELLLSKYAEEDRGKVVAENLQSDRPATYLLRGMVGAQASFIFCGSYTRFPRPILYVANTKEEAAYFYHNTVSLLPRKPVWFFPDSSRQPGQYKEVNSNQVLQRTETINKITGLEAAAHIIITYPEALAEKVVSPQVLNKNRINLAIRENLDVDFLIEILVEYGFSNVDFVYEPGQFSVRGGIVDIFSFGNEWPYRIELFDEEIESIRTFNPMDQLSIKNIAKLSIVPNINNQFQSDDRVSILKVLPEKAQIWIANESFLIDRLQDCFEVLRDSSEAFVEDEREVNKPTIVTPAEIMNDLAVFDKVFLNEKSAEFAIDEEVIYEAKPQPSFNKNFTFLIEDLKNLQNEGFTSYLFTDSARQIQRFESIFDDLEANVTVHPVLKSIDKGFIDPYHKISCYTDHEIFQRFHKYNLRRGFTRDQAMTLKFLRELQPGDYVTHIDHGVGRYSGLEKIDINGHLQESVRLIYKNNDILYVGIQSLHKISKFVGSEGTAPTLNKLGTEAWKTLKRKTKQKVKDIASELIKLYAKRKASVGHQFPPDGYLQNELEASFFYEDTPDQLKATLDVKEDMESSSPMDRLICGDVGFGKTEVAIRAAFKAVCDGKQVAILVPTTILALQHFKTLNERLSDFAVTVDYLNRFRTSREKTQIFKDAEAGKIDILIGTHGILNKQLKFKDLGLLIIDEEQKFGVAAKEKLRNLKVNVDTLTLTATPIPRTLQFSLMAARDLSIIRTPPPNRQPIHTETRVFNDELIKDAIYYEVNRGGQVFFVHNRVKNLPEMMVLLKRLCPDIDIGMAHGQMDSKDLEKALVRFIDGHYDVLLCTNIIETGLDISNANTIIINNAHQFGLSDLHQLRGRVGRSNRKAFCYLFSPPLSTLTTEARKRLRTLEEFSDLGSGFNIAMRDLDIRGAGNLLGGEQSGFINEIGFDTYTKILEEAIQELKETEFKELFLEDRSRNNYVRDVQIETDFEMLIPDEYVNSIQERLNLYTELDSLNTEDELSEFASKMSDRFGPLPQQVETLFEALRLRWLCKDLSFERCILKNSKLQCFFVLNPQSTFYETTFFKEFLALIAADGVELNITLKQSRQYLIMVHDSIDSLEEARALLSELGSRLLKKDSTIDV